MSTLEIPENHWREELDSFSRTHDGWLVRVTVDDAAGQPRVAVQNLPLQGIVAGADAPPSIAVIVGDTPGTCLTHEVKNVVDVTQEQTDAGVISAIKVRAGDGSTTTVEFRRPEEVDGLPVPRVIF